MVEGEDKNKKDESKGFAGLSSLLSNVDTSPPPAAIKEPIETTGTSSGKESPVSSADQPRPQPRQKQNYQEPPKPLFGSSGGKWVLGIGAVIGVLWLIGQSNKPTTSPGPAYALPAQSAVPSYSPPVQPQAPSHPTESRPPIGQNKVFSTDQIRYCLAEDIRMDGAKAVVNNYIESDVDRFNAMVADYNSRCGSFRYRRGALESARGDIALYRSQLQAEGRSRFARPSTGALSTPGPSRPVPDATVQAIQSKLNELGYEVGAADGLMGRGTRSAILAFQHDNGLVADGNPTTSLLQQLTVSRQLEQQRAQPPAPSVAVTPPIFTPLTRAPVGSETPNPTRSVIPQNAHINYIGNDWECDRGYYRYSNACHAVQVPQNGKLTYLGNDWDCNRGYYKYSNACHAVQVPQNGKLTYLGNDWDCNRGYKKSGNACHAVQIPQNGKLTYLGNDWECSRGYYKYGNACHAVQVPQNGKLTYLGNDWECESGYRKTGDSCVSVYER